MKLLYPQFLWALTALAIPLLIHLFNFRRYTTIYFSSNRFLQQAVKDSKSINRLRQLLIMATRMLALAMLVIAFAQPYWPTNADGKAANEYSSIYIDNSPSMLAVVNQTDLLTKARTQAVEIIKSLPEQQKIQVLTNDFAGRQLNYYSKLEAIEMIDEIKPSYAFRSNKAISEKIIQAQEKLPNPNIDVYWLSDFQRAAFAENLSAPDSWTQTIVPIRAEQEVSNLAIDSVWFDRPVLQPGFDQELNIQLSNSGDSENRRVAISLTLDGQLQGAKEIEVNSGTKTTTQFTIRVSDVKAYQGEVSIKAGTPSFDNTFYFGFNVSEPFQILLTGNNENLAKFKKLFKDSIFKLNYSPLLGLDYQSLKNYDLIILNAAEEVPSGLALAISENLKAGKNAVIIPSSLSADGVNTVLTAAGFRTLGTKSGEARVFKISWQDSHYKGVFNNRPKTALLPQVEEYYHYSKTQGYPLLSFENGEPFVSRLTHGAGQLILVTSDLQKNNFDQHPLFVPTLLNAALYSRPSAELYTLAGKPNGPKYASVPNSDSPLRLNVNDEEIIPRQRNVQNKIELYDLASEIPPGVYEVENNQTLMGYLGVNPPPAESEWHFLTDAEIASNLGTGEDAILNADDNQLAYIVGRAYKGSSLWQWFVASTLLFLFIEMMLIKIWK